MDYIVEKLPRKDIKVEKGRIAIKTARPRSSLACRNVLRADPPRDHRLAGRGSGFIQFETNDPANTIQMFLKLYPATDKGDMGLSFPVEVTAMKLVGSYGAAYGIVFCATDDQNYYKVLIKCFWRLQNL